MEYVVIELCPEAGFEGGVMETVRAVGAETRPHVSPSSLRWALQSPLLPHRRRAESLAVRLATGMSWDSYGVLRKLQKEFAGARRSWRAASESKFS